MLANMDSFFYVLLLTDRRAKTTVLDDRKMSDMSKSIRINFNHRHVSKGTQIYD